MLEYTVFNNWYYGTSLTQLDENKVNVGVFNPAGISELIDNPNIDLKIIRVMAHKKTRLLRQLHREDNPNVDEIVRRYSTDKTDFSDLEFEYTEINNNELEDLDKSSLLIAETFGLIPPQGKKG
jgi:guanylate kinase